MFKNLVDKKAEEEVETEETPVEPVVVEKKEEKVSFIQELRKQKQWLVAALVRLICSVNYAFTVWYVVLFTRNWLNSFWIAVLIFCFIEFVYNLVIYRNITESHWLSLWIYLYITGMIPMLLMLVRYKLDNFRFLVLQAINSDYTDTYRINDEIIAHAVERTTISYATSWGYFGELYHRGRWRFNVQIVENIFYIILVIVQWIVPRTDETNEDKADRLLYYISIVSDIWDFFALLQSPKCIVQSEVVLTCMIFWIVALFRLCLNLGGFAFSEFDEDVPDAKLCYYDPFSKRSWNLITTILCQDLPFVTVRVIAYFIYEVRTKHIFLYMFKNGAICMIIGYHALTKFYAYISSLLSRLLNLLSGDHESVLSQTSKASRKLK
ncbi:hypothetical protein SNEBB_010719 [Seison nebaliae]|nr:hypothetical protein SNEBB_010719 [Seison nebaliae]